MSQGRRDDDDAFEDADRPRAPRRPPARPDDEGEGRGRERRPRPRDDYDDDYDDRPRRRSRGGLIPRNGLALAGYYLAFAGLIVILGTFAIAMYQPELLGRNPALFGLVIFGLGGLLGLLALIFGILGLVRANRYPEGGGTGHSVTAIVLGVLIILGLIALLLLGRLADRGGPRFP